jgi:hypothetical protein
VIQKQFLNYRKDAKWKTREAPDCRVGQFSTRSWVRNQAAPEVRVRKTAQKYSGAPAQVLHEKVEMAERVEGHLPHLVHIAYLSTPLRLSM